MNKNKTIPKKKKEVIDTSPPRPVSQAPRRLSSSHLSLSLSLSHRHLHRSRPRQLPWFIESLNGGRATVGRATYAGFVQTPLLRASQVRSGQGQFQR